MTVEFCSCSQSCHNLHDCLVSNNLLKKSRRKEMLSALTCLSSVSIKPGSPFFLKLIWSFNPSGHLVTFTLTLIVTCNSPNSDASAPGISVFLLWGCLKTMSSVSLQSKCSGCIVSAHSIWNISLLQNTSPKHDSSSCNWITMMTLNGTQFVHVKHAPLYRKETKNLNYRVWWWVSCDWLKEGQQ